MDTIFALSSGTPPAGIAVVRVSGPSAASALNALAGRLPTPRRATAAILRDGEGCELDRAIVLWMPGPHTATGEDVAEFHLHGGRAVVAAVDTALSLLPGMRRAEPGEFTRRSFANGRIDLAEAEGLADLLTAETETQRRAALAMAGGALSRQIETWRGQVLMLSAQVEAVLDFADEDDSAELGQSFHQRLAHIAEEIRQWLSRPNAERLRDGIRVALAGPPNSGKSSLFNALLGSDAAIVSDIPGTTRDVIERPVGVAGIPFVLVDTAGMHGETVDPVEIAGIARAEAEVMKADIVLWLGEEGRGPATAWEVSAKSDIPGSAKRVASTVVSARTGEGIDALWKQLAKAAAAYVPPAGEVALNNRQRSALERALAALGSVSTQDPLLTGEALRLVRREFDAISGRASTEDMLDTLFGRFCIGK